MLESNFQKGLIKELKSRYPGCIVLKNDASYIQGFPDLIILYKDHYACLECKRSGKATHRPNQDYWVDKVKEMSFASFVWPENKEEVLNDLDRSFERFSQG